MLILLENQISGFRDYPMLHVAVQQRMVSIGTMVKTVERANPGRRVYHLLFSCLRGCTDDLSMHAGQNRLDALVDPYTGKILKTVCWQRTPIGILYDLHGSLFSGDSGESVNAVAGLSLVLLGATGLYLWPGWRSARRAFAIRWRGSTFQVSYDVHKLTGVVAVLFFFTWAITAAAQVFWPEPSEPIAVARGSGKMLDLDRLAAIGRSALPGELTLVYMPVNGTLVVRTRVPGDSDPYGYSYAAVNVYSGRVTQVYDERNFPLASRIRAAMYAVHIGSPGGLALRLIYAAVGIAPALLFLTAFLMWLQKLKPNQESY